MTPQISKQIDAADPGSAVHGVLPTSWCQMFSFTFIRHRIFSVLIITAKVIKLNIYYLEHWYIL